MNSVDHPINHPAPSVTGGGGKNDERQIKETKMPSPVFEQFEQNPNGDQAIVRVLYFELVYEIEVLVNSRYEKVQNTVSDRAGLLRVVDWDYEF